ncbi:hypothetical protein C3473_11215 [Mycobacterium kansasii]|uniref:MucR family transcriptional regulator n=1 Tax=Mycobacterium kansasii TaxID=1768 RepID=UPI000CDDFE09|nr:MucR family transcriptional regulator [Mycobacterium kansasii]POX94944.1 hypothetical protein C3473_11215 [Mycobacterium kansasii]
MRIGDRDGFGEYGRLTITVGNRVLCHECGRDFLHLATHLARTHGITAERYRLAHGLPLTIPLVAATVSQRMAAAWEANRDVHLDTLNQHRDPARAQKSTRPASEWTAATRAARRERLRATRGRSLTEAEKNLLGDSLPLAEWCRRVRALLADDPTLTVASISRAFDMTPSWAYQRLYRYPAS